jgi:hypothetical protein
MEESLVAVKHGNMEKPTYAQSQWSAALQLRSELDKRFDELKLNATLECKTTGNRITAASLRPLPSPSGEWRSYFGQRKIFKIKGL